MKILIVMPKLVEKSGDYYDMPLGVLYISAALKKSGFDVETLNLNHTDVPTAAVITDSIQVKGIDIVATGGLSREYNMVHEILAAAKNARKDITTIVGGGLVTSEPKLMLDHLPMDFGVLGEGEITVVDLLCALRDNGDMHNIDGLIFRDGRGAAVQTKKRRVVEDIDTLPLPDYDGFAIDVYLDNQRVTDSPFMFLEDDPRFLPIICSRGCYYNCTFCYHPLGNRYRQRSLDSFFTELDVYVNKYRVNILYIMDELFSMDEEYMSGFCERIRAYNINWMAQTRPDISISLETLKKLKKSDMFYLGYGLENATDHILKSMKKHTSIKMVEEKYALTKNAGISTGGNLLFGDPAETMETVAANLTWWKQNRSKYNINAVAQITPFPGSALWKHCLGKKLIPDKIGYLQGGCRRINMTSLPDNKFHKIFQKIERQWALGRSFAQVISVVQHGFDQQRGTSLYTVEVICPHCRSQVRYNRIIITRLAVLNIWCRKCLQNFDLLPSIFTHIQEQTEQFRDRLLKIACSERPVSFSPFLFRENFLEYMKIFGLDTDSLNIQYQLDRQPLPGMESPQATDYPVLQRTRANIKKFCAGHVFAVLPWPHDTYRQIVHHLRDKCDVDIEDIVFIPFS